jgi:putative hydrolase of the HAD superfamily
MTKTQWVIFDMDNTLINTEPLYVEASEQFAKLMHEYGRCDPDEVKRVQNKIDAELFVQFGYSTDRFAESFERTVRTMLNIGVYRSQSNFRELHREDLIKRARKIAMAVFDQKSIEYTYAADVVRMIANAGYKIAVITAGERWVQIKRFDDLTMRNLFHDCWVVLRKDEQVFSDFCIKHDVDIANSWMIGDSLKSDIIPSSNIGLRAIHLQTSNWESRDGKLKVPDGVTSVKDLSEVPSIILGVKYA